MDEQGTEPRESRIIAGEPSHPTSAARASGEGSKREWLADPGNILKAAQFAEDRLQYESSWVGQRMSWLVISQSFLFSAFVGTLNLLSAKLTILGDDKPVPPQITNLALAKHFMTWGIPVLALVQAVAAYVAICAAKRVQDELSDLRGEIHQHLANVPLLEAFPLLGARNRPDGIKHTYYLGGLASSIIPQTLILIWSLILASLILGPRWEKDATWVYCSFAGEALFILTVLNPTSYFDPPCRAVKRAGAAAGCVFLLGLWMVAYVRWAMGIP